MAPRRTTVDDYERRLVLAEQLLEGRLDEPVTPEELARAAHFSLHHFHRIFRARRGETVMQHVRRLRLERAARKLRLSEEGILPLALEAGYESHEAFTRAFADRFGVAPSVFREQPAPRIVEWRRTRAAGPAIEVRVERFPPVHVAFMRSRGGYSQVGVCWEQLVAWASQRGLLAQPAPLYGICPDDPDVTPEDQLRFDACVVVGDSFVPEAPLSTTTIPAGLYAVGLHIGPYDRLSHAYDDVIGRWFPESGYDLAAEPVIEHYLNDPSTAEPHELRTEVRVKIAD